MLVKQLGETIDFNASHLGMELFLKNRDVVQHEAENRDRSAGIYSIAPVNKSNYHFKLIEYLS